MVTARNISHSIHDNELFPTIEAVLTVSDKSIEYVGGSLVNTEHTKTIRLEMSPDHARQFARNLGEWADDADEQKSRLTLAPEEAAT